MARVLVAEDDPQIMALTERTLRGSGHLPLTWADYGAGYTVRVSALDEALPLGENSQAESAAVINRAMERLIRQCPQQYLWGYHRYKTPRSGD